MGKLAKTAILGGKKVDILKATTSRSNHQLDDVIARVLKKSGFSVIAKKIIGNEDLSLKEIEFLLSSASLTILFKLNEMKSTEDKQPIVYPVYYIPAEDLLLRYDVDEIPDLLVNRFGESLNKKSILYFSIKDFSDIDQVWGEIVSTLKLKYPEALFYGPSLEIAHKWLSYNYRESSSSVAFKRLVTLASKLKKIGFDALGANSFVKLSSVGVAANFENFHCTKLETFPTPRLFAKELFKLSKISQEKNTIDEWSVGLLSKTGEKVARILNIKDASLQYAILRAFLVGKLCLPNVQKKSIYSRYLSLETIRYLKFLGVNHAIYTSADEVTSLSLGLPDYNLILQEISK